MIYLHQRVVNKVFIYFSLSLANEFLESLKFVFYVSYTFFYTLTHSFSLDGSASKEEKFSFGLKINQSRERKRNLILKKISKGLARNFATEIHELENSMKA